MVDLAQLRSENYNAEVESIRLVHDDLMILRVRPDIGVSRFLAGQYTVLGLGYWEPRAADCQPEGDITALKQQLIKRAYSVSSPILNDAGVAVGVNELVFLEFYIALIRQAREHPPALTPRIFALEPGSRIFCGPRFHGRYGLEPVSPESNVIFAGTGTGEAPHNAMIGELLRSRHQGR
ncbi:MAG: ferredoxin--NADP reductase, partial [bacterium]|nr:ferredoxin--NADP reductase [bacterium]